MFWWFVGFQLADLPQNCIYWQFVCARGNIRADVLAESQALYVNDDLILGLLYKTI
jgi:hypothetical protein